MASYASLDDVRISLGRPLSDDEADQADGLLDRIESRIRQRITDLDDRIDDDVTFVDILVEIEADAVARVIKNPSGLLSEQDGDYMYTRDRSMASGSLRLTDEEWSRLGVTKGAFTIAPYLGREPGVEPSSLAEGPVWVDISGDA